MGRTSFLIRYDSDVRQPEWTGREPCLYSPDVFHPDQGDRRAGAVARWMCGRCPTQQRCLEWAVQDPTLEGIHAGTTAAERARIRGRRQ